MTKDQLNDEYFEWMYRIVCNDSHYNNLSYRHLLCFLHDTEFVYMLEMDGNRSEDGIDFRYRFGYERDYPREIIDKYLINRPCSVLEMMIALAFRVEEQIMDDPIFGNRTGQWFWNMIVSLGLGNMSDLNFDQYYAGQIIDNFLNRNYEENGEGGLFTIDNAKHDMRSAEIWYQMMWYLDENFDFSI